MDRRGSLLTVLHGPPASRSIPGVLGSSRNLLRTASGNSVVTNVGLDEDEVLRKRGSELREVRHLAPGFFCRGSDRDTKVQMERSMV